jgi:hypothetical protein
VIGAWAPDRAEERLNMRVFVPMPDVWDDPSAYRNVKLVPYRVGMPVWRGLVPAPQQVEPPSPPTLPLSVPPKAA